MPDRYAGSSPPKADGQSPELVLAALERAVRHRPGRAGAPYWTILEHLHVARRSQAARTVRSRLDELEQRGWTARAQERGVPLWRLTPAGRRRLSRALRSRTPPLLGESPQHAAWRQARTLAAQEIDRFRAELEHDLARAERMLAGEGSQGPSSDEWLLLGERLRRDCRRLGSARHCLVEWREPDDAAADIDEGAAAGAGEQDEPARRLRALRAGRRNVRLWREED